MINSTDADPAATVPADGGQAFVDEPLALQEQLLARYARPSIVEMLSKSGILSQCAGTHALAVLDLTGCGTLFVSELELRREGGLAGLKVVVCDHSEGAVELVQEEVFKRGWDNVKARLREPTDLSSLGDTFDYVFLQQPPHEDGSVKNLLTQISAVLNPSAVLVSVVNVPLHDLVRHETLSSADPPLDSCTFHPSDLDSLTTLYTATGFSAPSYTPSSAGMTNEDYKSMLEVLGIELPPVNQECTAFVDAEWEREGKAGLPRVDWEQMVVVAKKA